MHRFPFKDKKPSQRMNLLLSHKVESFGTSAHWLVLGDSKFSHLSYQRLLQSPHCLLETIKSVGTQRQIMVIFPFFEDLNVFRPRLLQYPLCLPETIKFVGTQRQIMVICPFVKDLNVFQSRLLQSPPLPSRDNQIRWHIETNYGHLPLCRRPQCLSTETATVSPLLSRDKRVRWHAEINYGYMPFFEDFNVFRSRLLKSPLPSRGKRVHWNTKTNYGHLSLIKDFNIFQPRLF